MRHRIALLVAVSAVACAPPRVASPERASSSDAAIMIHPDPARRLGGECELRFLGRVPVSPECLLGGETGLASIVADPACRVKAELPSFVLCGVVQSAPPVSVRAGESITFPVVVSNPTSEALVVDLDVGTSLEVGASPLPGTPLPARTGRTIWTCPAPWGSEPSDDGPARARVLLPPAGRIVGQAIWRATWSEYDDRCHEQERPLPRGRYRLAVQSPLAGAAAALQMRTVDLPPVGPEDFLVETVADVR